MMAMSLALSPQPLSSSRAVASSCREGFSRFDGERSAGQGLPSSGVGGWNDNAVDAGHDAKWVVIVVADDCLRNLAIESGRRVP